LSDCWLNTPDVRTADDDVVSDSCSATVNDLLDGFHHAAANPSRQSFQHADVTFQTNPISDTLSSPPTPIPLPVLQFYDNEASLEEQLVTPPVLAKTTQPDLNTSTERMTVSDLSLDRPDNHGSLSSTMFNSPLSEPRQEQFILIQLPLNSNDLIAVLSRITNNNEFVVDNNLSTENHHHHHHHHQQEEDAEITPSENHTATSTAAEPSTGDQPHTSGDGETGNDVNSLSEEDVLSMLEDAASIVVG